MSYRPGDTVYVSFTTQTPAGASADADSTPTASMRRNGTVDGTVTVSMTHNATGDYTASASIPNTYVGGDEVEFLISAAVGGVGAKAAFPLGKLERTTTLAATQSYNNTGQTTPLPATTAFTGPHSVTLVFHDSVGNPVSGVVFTVRGFGSAVADAGGAKTIALASASYTIQALPAGGVFWTDTTIAVSADATFTFTGTAVSIPSPASPSQTTAYLTTRDGQGNALPAVTLTFQLVDPQAGTDSYDQTTFTATSDSSALLQVPLLKSTQYQARVGGGAWVAFTTGSGSTFPLPEILGMYC